MRLSFAQGEHAEFVLDSGTASLGSAPGNTLVVNGRDVAPRHARVTVDARGAVLDVLDANARTHVNARPVRERAILRAGDVLCLGSTLIALKADSDDLIETGLPPEQAVPPAPTTPARVVLRGVSGAHFGKAISVNGRLVVGSGADSGLVIDEARLAPRHALIENVDDAIYLRGIGAEGGGSVNGIPSRNAIVHPGDQLVFERSHFIVEAPGLPLRGERSSRAFAVTAERDAVTVEQRPGGSGNSAIGWLIGAAALIGLGLLLLFHRGL